MDKNNYKKEINWLIRDKYNGIKNPELLESDLVRLDSGEPLDYVIGWKPFLNLKIDLSKNPLIPRVETEFWVSRIIQDIGKSKYIKILDMCAGSGCVGLAILSAIPDSYCTFVDIDQNYEEQININANINKIKRERYNVIISDLWQSVPEDDKFDIIVCNPPYVPDDRVLDNSVTNFEPKKAIFSADSGLEVIKKFLMSLKPHLFSTSVAYLEFDTGQEDEIKNICKKLNLNIEIFNDQFDRCRYAKISLC